MKDQIYIPIKSISELNTAREILLKHNQIINEDTFKLTSYMSKSVLNNLYYSNTTKSWGLGMIPVEREIITLSELEKNIAQIKFVLFHTDAWQSKASRVFFGVFSSEELAQKAAEENNLLTDFSDIVIVECYENFFEEK